METGLSEEKIREYLKSCMPETSAPALLRVLDGTDSTNRAAKELAADGAPGFSLVVSHTQTAGRGRLGKSFCSPPGGLYMSLILRPDPDPERLALITPAAALAVCRALETVSDGVCHIKWVNDIYVRGRKTAGILAEAVADGSGTAVILGVGINVTTDPAAFPPDVAERAGALFPCGVGCADPFVRERLCALVASETAAELSRLYSGAVPPAFIAEYRRRSMLDKREVTVLRGGGEYPAAVIGIDEKCRLGVVFRGGEKDGTVEYLSSGDVSLRL